MPSDHFRSGSLVRHADGRQGIVLRPGGPGVVIVRWGSLSVGRSLGMTRATATKEAWATIEGEPVWASEIEVVRPLQ